MKKITLFFVALFTVTFVGAQNEITISDSGIGLSQSVSGNEAQVMQAPCSQGQDGFDINGAAGSNVNNGIVSAVDIVIPAGEFFTLESISNLNMLTFAGFLPTTATVTYFEDAGDGFPSNTEIGSESGISLTINSSAPWVNPAADVHNVEFDVTPITFEGGATEWNYVDFGTGAGPETTSEGFYTLNGDCDVLGVNDNALAQISLYPNPTTDVINIKTPTSLEITEVVLYDLLGRNTGASYINGSVDVSALSRGVYILSVKTSKGTLTQKVVKK